MRKYIKQIAWMGAFSSVLLLSGCAEVYSDGYHYETYNDGYYYDDPYYGSSVIAVYSYPYYTDRPYYFYNGRYYYGGYYRDGCYYYRGHRYRGGSYHHRHHGHHDGRRDHKNNYWGRDRGDDRSYQTRDYSKDRGNRHIRMNHTTHTYQMQQNNMNLGHHTIDRDMNLRRERMQTQGTFQRERSNFGTNRTNQVQERSNFQRSMRTERSEKSSSRDRNDNDDNTQRTGHFFNR